ncbi:MAG: phosphatase PAP2 family protein [Methyloceanibacter sp.]|uniref:phosphatase PAP2 family protein n=1 Tax=Methyloceanibacter sp. TaxID=1965321 RepID=UPI001D96DEE5|nr:phosphatase PAP2 family protein [Methyloceanibacter sp.]MCB1442380.1 phosphatase PAP2 family protein [Methyloceanibacter sp.]MCC0059197.1 phosphatase PAP2 family protein [Hyphomicrobiaceae bacterium]
MARRWLFATLALGLFLGLVFALFPEIDLKVAALFFDGKTSKFPISRDESWNTVRNLAYWVPYLLVAPSVFVLIRKLVFPRTKMIIAPSVALFLVGSFIAGPGVLTNLVLKDNWGRPRPNQVEEFGGKAGFEPWWRPGGACERNCSFVSGEGSLAFWTVAPAMLAPPPARPFAMGAAVLYGASVGGLRVAFGRHFLSDVLFAGVFTIVTTLLFYALLLAPSRRNDARLELQIERFAFTIHRGLAFVLGGIGTGLARLGAALRHSGEALQRRSGPD